MNLMKLKKQKNNNQLQVIERPYSTQNKRNRLVPIRHKNNNHSEKYLLATLKHFSFLKVQQKTNHILPDPWYPIDL